MAEPIAFTFNLDWHVVEVLGQGPVLAMQGRRIEVAWGSEMTEAVVQEVGIDFAHRRCWARLVIYEPPDEVPWAHQAAGMFSIAEGEPGAQA